MIGVAAEASGDLATLGERVREALRREAAGAADTLRQRIADGPLNGEVLRRRTGRLAESLATSIVESDTGIVASVADTAPYTRFQQLGFDGTESVKQSLRTIRQAFGRPIPARAVVVRAHQRNVHYPAHPFLTMDGDAVTASLAGAVAREIGR